MNGPDSSQRWWKRSLAGASLVAAAFGAFAWALGTPPQNVVLYVAVSGVFGLCALFAHGEERGWE